MNEDSITLAIDLGTTYAKMACQRRDRVEVILNHDCRTTTPCAVWLSPQGNWVIGEEAKWAMDTDFDNVKLSFVRDLGSPVEYEFPRNSLRIKSVELTAEFLKALRGDAEQRLLQEMRAVVITVPQGAGLARCQATKQAAFLAGFAHCQIIQDATAAALATAAATDHDGHKAVLIYDFGGSSFTASLLRVRDGMFQSLGHACDSSLGGISLDREIVEQVFVPELLAAHSQLDLSKNDLQAVQVYSKLTAASEAAKLSLSRVNQASTLIPALYGDERRPQINLKCRLTRDALECLAAPLVDRTISICDRVLADSRIAASEVNNVIPVGGMALIPFVRQRIEERFGKRMVTTEFDPDTTIVRGAAIFAALQSETAPCAARTEEDKLPEAYALACVSSSSLPHAVGIALDNNQVDRLFEKGAILPAIRRCRLVLRSGQSGEVLRLQMVEGESDLADRNRDLGILTVSLDDVARDLLAGTEVEVTVEIDESYRFRVRTNIPMLVIGHEQHPELSKQTPNWCELSESLSSLKARLSSIHQEATPVDIVTAVRISRLVAQAERLLESSKTGSDAEECAEVLNNISTAIEDAKFDCLALRRELEEHLTAIRELLAHSPPAASEYGESVLHLEQAANDAIAQRNLTKAQDCIGHLRLLRGRISEECPDSAAPPAPGQLWLACLAEIERCRHQMDDPALVGVASLVDRGNQAIASNDLSALQLALRDAVTLLSRTSDSSSASQKGLLEAFPSLNPSSVPEQIQATSRPVKTGSPVAPSTKIDKVHFSVASPPGAQPGQHFIVDVWAHLERQRAEVERRVQQAWPQTETPPVIRPKGPFKIERGTTLYVRLRFADLLVDPLEDVILWEGEIGNASFEVFIPRETSEGVKSGSVTVHWEGGLQIARVPLQILVAAKAVSVAPTTQPLHHIRKAFASYASPDRDEVIGRIQGMQKIAPDLDVFLDVVNLRSGEDWEKKLWQVIPESDVFYLFWSAHAKASPWVEKEWRCALGSRGEEFIDPVPLVSPDEVRPPDELRKKHFNDWILAYRRRTPT